jgi:hypothetical protein
MKIKGVVIFLLLIVLINFISASFIIGNSSHSIGKTYGPSGDISGWINISLKNDPSDSVFTDSFGNSISLIDLIKENSNFNYNCSTKNCLTDYTIGDSSVEKDIQLNENVSKTIGFLFTGNIIDVTSVSFTFTSNAPTSCRNQLKLDFGGNDIFEFGNNKASSQICSDKNYGCFNSTTATEEYNLGTTPYCQKITFDEGAAFNVGAWIKKISSNSPELSMWIYDGNKKVAACPLPDPTSSGSEITCKIDYLVTQPKDYYVCIYSALDGAYRTRGNVDPSTQCGFHSEPIEDADAAYQIFIQKLQFDSVGTVQVTDQNGNISSVIKNYIINKYGSLNCLNKNCVVPMKLVPGTDQTVILKDLEIDYEKTSGEVAMNEFYDLQESAPQISANFQKLYLDSGNFSVTSEYGNTSYKLNLDDRKIFSDYITISPMASIKGLSPTSTALGYTTTFKVDLNKSNYNISRYDWSFDENTQSSSTNQASYKFTTLGAHNVTISITDSQNNKASKRFQVVVYSPEKQIVKEIKDKHDSLMTIKSEIATLPKFDQDSLNALLKLNNTENSLADIEQKYATASTDAEYLEIVNKLFQINLPESISITDNAVGILYFPKKENINLDVLKQITGEDYNVSDLDDYLDGVESWNMKNLETKINFREISGLKDDVQSPLLEVFELDTKDKTDTNPDYYLIVKQMGNLKFESGFGEIEQNGYFYKKLNKGTNTIYFSTTDNIDFADLPVFISPSIANLPLNKVNIVEAPKIKWWIPVLAVVILLVIAYIVYIILQQWYKTKYENHLFKNRNNLFNLVTYINNERKTGVDDSEIEKRLKKAKWDSEQIDYAMRKYSGKRTGMFELPFFGLFGKKTPQQTSPPGIPPQGVVRGPYFPQKSPF